MRLLMQGSSLIRAVGLVKCCTETFRTVPDLVPASLGLRRFVHESNYGKNDDEIGSGNKVPDDVIQLGAQKWWMPHPKTGVFGPEQGKGEADGDPQHAKEMGGASVLDQHAWFRPAEDVQKQPLN